jgi:hypothetical protein
LEDQEEVSVGRSLEGTIVAYSIHDGVGRIRLDDGEELRFSIRDLDDLVPALDVRVAIAQVEPYPLGGRRAKSITLKQDRTSYDELRRSFEKLQGEALRRDMALRSADIVPERELESLARTPQASSAPPVATPKVARALAKTIRRVPAQATPATRPPRARRPSRARTNSE